MSFQWVLLPLETMTTPRKSSAKKSGPKFGAPSSHEQKKLRKLIEVEKFDKDGLRILTAPLSRDEFDFSGITKDESNWLALCEYMREIQLTYLQKQIDEGRKQFFDLKKQIEEKNEVLSPEAEKWSLFLQKTPSSLFFPRENWPHKYIGHYRWYSDYFFPLPFQAIKRDYHSFRYSEPEKLYNGPLISENDEQVFLSPALIGMGSLPHGGIISERGSYWYSCCSAHENAPGCSPGSPGVHYVRIDLTGGRENMKKALARWIDEKLPKASKRQWQKIAEERLDELAAWRAHRAGLNHGEFCTLKPRTPYSDASAYRTAWKKAEKELRLLMKTTR